MIIDNFIDMRDTMYPSIGNKLIDSNFETIPCSTTYGVVLSGKAELEPDIIAKTNQYFSIWSLNSKKIKISGEVVFFTRIGFKGQNTLGGPIEKSGRLCYIDGCSDSLLVYPPRLGDPSLNVLYFPAGTNQTFHIHPSIRLGVVLEGEGYSNLKINDKEKEIPLKKGDLFCIEERETHRFRTTNSSMVVIPYHPDGDWGPTDHNHSMLNRTYLTK
jgi:quercetin dioxygenase-like cupin family protein